MACWLALDILIMSSSERRGEYILHYEYLTRCILIGNKMVQFLS